MFSITVCTQDMKKVLLSLRRNGEEVGTVYDQNHTDNHRNSMAGQTVLVELVPGDRVQLKPAKAATGTPVVPPFSVSPLSIQALPKQHLCKRKKLSREVS